MDDGISNSAAREDEWVRSKMSIVEQLSSTMLGVEGNDSAQVPQHDRPNLQSQPVTAVDTFSLAGMDVNDSTDNLNGRPHVFEDNDDNSEVSGSGRMLSSGGRMSSNRMGSSGRSSRRFSQRSLEDIDEVTEETSRSRPDEFVSATVTVVANYDDQLTSTGKNNSDKSVLRKDLGALVKVISGSSLSEEGKDVRHRRTCYCIIFLLVVTPVSLLIALLVTSSNKTKNSNDASSSALETSPTFTPTTSPSTSLAPTVTMVPFTVAIWLDAEGEETSWELICNNETLASVPLNTYDIEDYSVVKTIMVPDGADCIFTIYDYGEDGLCCHEGHGFYQIYLANQQDIPNGLLRKGGKFESEERTEFRAKGT